MTSSLYVITVVMDDELGFLNTRSSLLSQNDQDFHWIVVDSSKNPIKEFCEFAGTVKIKKDYVWTSPSGIYEAMNHALFSLNDGWVLFLNAGDTLKDEFSTKLMKNDISLAPDKIGAIGYAVEHISPAGNIWHISYPKINKPSGSNYTIAEINHQGFVARLSAIIAAGYFDTTLRFAADGKLMDSILNNWEFILSNQIISKFVIGGRSATNYSRVLKEIDTYRPYSTPRNNRILNRYFNVVKNSIRMKILVLSSHFPKTEDLILRLRKFL